MSDIDRVFARLGGRHVAASDQREVRNIARKGSGTGSRVVEVVRLKPRAGTAEPAQQRTDFQLRSATWENGFPTHSARMPAAEVEPAAAPTDLPTTHVMPMWERSADPVQEPVEQPSIGPDPVVEPKRRRSAAPRGETAGPAAVVRRVADPFDADDDGANCLRCGYMVEPARERRGLMTCAACGSR